MAAKLARPSVNWVRNNPGDNLWLYCTKCTNYGLLTGSNYYKYNFCNVRKCCRCGRELVTDRIHAPIKRKVVIVRRAAK